MKALHYTLCSLLLAFAACSTAPQLERPQLDAPSDADIAGTYTLVEETVTGRSLEKTELANARLELKPGGDLQLTEFPIFQNLRGIRGTYRKVNEGGKWFITHNRDGYIVMISPDIQDRMKALVVEGGNPSDLIIYYSSRESGYYAKWRKM